MPGQTIGEVSVKVRPDTTGFAQELKAQLSKIKDDFKVQVELDTKAAQAQFKTLKERIQRDDIHANVRLRVNKSELSRLSTSINQSLSNGFGGGRGGGNFFSGLFRGLISNSTKAVKGLSEVGKGFTNLVKSASGASDAAISVSGAFAQMGKGLAGAVIGVVTLLPQLAILSVLISAIAGAIVVLGGLAFSAVGALVAGFAGLPVILATALGGFAAVQLGMDGIKRAAETLRPEFDRLKQAVSNTFERGLVPVFEKLRVLFPSLQDGLTGIATKLVGAADGIANVVTSSQGLDNIRGAFAGIQVALDQMAPGLKSLLTSLLNIAGTEIYYRILGDTISGITQKFADFFEQLRTGSAGHAKLSDALIVLKTVLDSLTDVLLAVAQAATDFFVAAGPGIANFFSTLADKLGQLDWTSLGKTIGDMFNRMADAIARIPPETLNALLDAIGGIAIKVGEFADRGGFNVIIDGLGILMNAITAFMGIAQSLIDFFSNLISNVLNVAVALGVPGAAALKMQLDMQSGFNGATDAASKGSGAIKDSVRGMAGQVNLDSRTMADNLGNNARRGAEAARDNINRGAQGMVDGMRRGADGVGREAGTIPPKVQSNLKMDLAPSGESLISSFANGIRRAGHWAIAAAAWVAGQVRNLFPFSPAKTGPFSGRGYTTYSGRALINDWALGMEKAAPAAVRTVEAIANRVQNGMAGNLSGSISAEGYGDFTASMTAAMSGMEFVIDERGGRVLAKVVNRENSIQAVRRINGG